MPMVWAAQIEALISEVLKKNLKCVEFTIGGPVATMTNPHGSFDKRVQGVVGDVLSLLDKMTMAVS